MANDLNNVVLVGRLTKDPEIRYTTGGTACAKISLANGEKIKQGNEWKDYTNFFECVVWGNQAVNCEKFLKKGSQVAISGKLKQERWEKDGKNNSRVSITVINMQFLTPANNSGQTQRPQQQQPAKNEDNLFNSDPWGDENYDMSLPSDTFSGDMPF